MYRAVLITGALISISLLIPLQSVSALNLSDRVSEILQNRITMWKGSQRFFCRRELLCGPNVLTRFYKQRAFQPAWSHDDGLLPQVAILVEEIHEADGDGLRPDDYHLANIEDLLAEMERNIGMNKLLDPDDLADLDLLLTDAFFLYGSHLLAGRVNPETIHSEWVIKSREGDLAEILQTALDAERVKESLEELRPQHAAYAALKRALLRYRNIMAMSDWPVVTQGQRMEKGDRGPRVSALRFRLIATGDLSAAGEADHDFFDAVLEGAVQRFQKRHGLKVDGVVGPATLNALNVPVKQRVNQIKFNMERWRWLPQDLERRYILVNIANFELDVVEHGHIVMTMRVVTGSRYRRTPVFTGKMTYIELNPYWHIPPKIAKIDILPNIKKDPRYLVKKNIRVFESWKAQAPEIDPISIDWSQITPENFSFKLRQDPGPSNALGRVKFMFPNKFQVYLHDTPARELFQKTKRTFSSGCIRIEKPIDLAQYLLRSGPKWTRERILAAINSGKAQIISIPEPIAVHLLYWTAWADRNGTIHFRNDIYGRDKPLDEALRERPPSP